MYTFKTSERNNEKATEYETKSLLYLMTRAKGGLHRWTRSNPITVIISYLLPPHLPPRLMAVAVRRDRNLFK